MEGQADQVGRTGGLGRKNGTSIISTGRGPAMSRDHAQAVQSRF